MEHSNLQSLHERVAVLEIEVATIQTSQKAIIDKLDELLHLKSQGMGAIWLVGILLSSGVVGLIATAIAVFNHRSHL